MHLRLLQRVAGLSQVSVSIPKIFRVNILVKRVLRNPIYTRSSSGGVNFITLIFQPF